MHDRLLGALRSIAGGETDPMPSAQIAALSANEARIYQLAPK